jgi:hypothetical protein
VLQVPVEDVLLQQCEEGFHRGVVGGGSNLTHRADQYMAAQCGQELPGTELPASVRVDDAAGHLAASGDGHGERVERDPGLHPVAIE